MCFTRSSYHLLRSGPVGLANVHFSRDFYERACISLQTSPCLPDFGPNSLIWRATLSFWIYLGTYLDLRREPCTVAAISKTQRRHPSKVTHPQSGQHELESTHCYPHQSSVDLLDYTKRRQGMPLLRAYRRYRVFYVYLLPGAVSASTTNVTSLDLAECGIRSAIYSRDLTFHLGPRADNR
ncbi:hypothetical protein CONLIGDRAFT_498091 [Coniochaeta ligniaria NRRL 30616]|uniref:Uncharacterized protein n=1 Tax=Coniochaeta ligniaria NRRL 30616 TaxID=1408157 RepID=A0A1J7IWT6_9PEZI|nr:hypothetical protein CONLIGDRAFT_498091 [Coniochaeta ligniaria NRRL 30616]